MQLNEEQQRHFDEEGYIFVPDLFTAEEVAVLKGEIPEIFAQRRPEVI
ncbi:MAG: proline hydroxylase, partial [Rhodospirillaceae bacterium]|nr:proline hydroxylase [Rhodospirillaceae bacterium]